ncbi:hypothetical protein ASE01_17650 [Nocardioides sp. Root190]|uniref:hypothetical protein n=1 Tax=Nocardioides sp. Root190 TaxID=1736488 RepID=UPI0006FBEBC8|nr:hypothetical protein [Nocardioides sp. Root190]KRB73841.1 hypothetical protein ASE01_17650 [Nocardioides sp. Root190]
MPGPLLRAAVLLIALATALVAALGPGIEPWDLAPWLARHGGLPYAVALAWLVLAPAALAAAALGVRRTPWPWVVAVSVHLLVPTLLVARFPHLFPDGTLLLLAASVVLGLASVVTVFPATDAHRGS